MDSPAGQSSSPMGQDSSSGGQASSDPAAAMGAAGIASNAVEEARRKKRAEAMALANNTGGADPAGPNSYD